MQAPYISTNFLRGFSRLVLAKGGNPGALYQSVGLEGDVIVEESTHTDKFASLLIPFDKFVYLLESTAKELDFPDIAMQLARQQDMMILAPLGPLLKATDNVQEALDTIIKYLKILVSGYQIGVHVEQEHLTLSFSLELPHIQQLQQYQDYAMACAVAVIYGLLGKTYPIRACYFLRSEHNQQTMQDYARYYGCPVAFGCNSLSLSVDKSVLSNSVSYLVRQIDSRVNYALSYRNSDIVEQVSQIISFSLANGSSSIEDIASAMHFSTRTLQQRLKDQGTSYRVLLDSVRFNMANQYLGNTFYRLTDIAALLGYSNLSAFSRSYKRWGGVYPSDMRKHYGETLKRYYS